MRLYNFLKDEFNLTKSKLNDFLNGHLILIDGKKASLQSKFEEGNILTIDNKEYKYKEKEYVYFAYNKPIGITCTLDKDKKDSIVNYINYKERIFPIGRLDKDSHGLIILTNDFKAPNIYLNKDNHVEKEYLVKVINKIDENFIKNIEKPILLDNKYTKECIAYLVDDYSFKIILKEGMYRQIRRMVKSLGNKVIDLERIRFGKLKLDIALGELKEISKEDI